MLNKHDQLEIIGKEALERNLKEAKNWWKYWKIDDPELENAIRIVYDKGWLHQLLSVWPQNEIATLLDKEPKEYFFDEKLKNVIRHMFEGAVPTYPNDWREGKEEDYIFIYDFLVDTDGYNCETGWLEFWFSVFDHEFVEEKDGKRHYTHHKEAFSGLLIIGIDILNATDDEIKTWKFARDFKFKKMSIENIEHVLTKTGRTEYGQSKEKLAKANSLLNTGGTTATTQSTT